MPGRTRGPAKHEATHQTSERSVETSNSGKWLDSLKSKASEYAKAIVTANSHAYTARQVNSTPEQHRHLSTKANPDHRMNEKLASKQPTFQNGALDDVARGREEYVRLVKLLEDAESTVKDVRDFQASKETEEGFFKEADAWLKVEREKAREAMGETNPKANAHIEKGVLHFAKRCSL